MTEKQMTEHERQFYQKKMKAIRAAVERGDEAMANRHAEDLRLFFGVE